MEQRQIARQKLGNRLMGDWDAAHEFEYKLAIAKDAALETGDDSAVQELLFQSKRDDVAEALGSNFDVSVKEGGALADRGKLAVKKTPIHGLSGSQQNMDALVMAFDSEKNGPIVDANYTPYDRYIQESASEVLSPQAISVLAAPGLRGGVASLSDENRIGRATDRAADYGRGYDQAGAATGGMPTDGGHSKKFPHAEFPEYSDARWNMGMEQGYVNKVTGDRTGEDAQASIRNSLRKRMHDDESGDTVRQLVNSWDVGKGFPEDRAQTSQKFLADKMARIGSERMDSDGDNRERSLVINNTGDGVVHVEGSLDKNGKNGKNGNGHH